MLIDDCLLCMHGNNLECLTNGIGSEFRCICSKDKEIQASYNNSIYYFMTPMNSSQNGQKKKLYDFFSNCTNNGLNNQIRISCSIFPNLFDRTTCSCMRNDMIINEGEFITKSIWRHRFSKNKKMISNNGANDDEIRRCLHDEVTENSTPSTMSSTTEEFIVEPIKTTATSFIKHQTFSSLPTETVHIATQEFNRDSNNFINTPSITTEKHFPDQVKNIESNIAFQANLKFIYSLLIMAFISIFLIICLLITCCLKYKIKKYYLKRRSFTEFD